MTQHLRARNVMMDPDQMKRVERLAKKEKRSVSAMLREAVVLLLASRDPRQIKLMNRITVLPEARHVDF